jgi:hypothetical protein
MAREDACKAALIYKSTRDGDIGYCQLGLQDELRSLRKDERGRSRWECHTRDVRADRDEAVLQRDVAGLWVRLHTL